MKCARSIFDVEFTRDKRTVTKQSLNLPFEKWKKFTHVSNQVNASAQSDQLRNFTLIVCKVYHS